MLSTYFEFSDRDNVEPRLPRVPRVIDQNTSHCSQLNTLKLSNIWKHQKETKKKHLWVLSYILIQCGYHLQFFVRRLSHFRGCSDRIEWTKTTKTQRATKKTQSFLHWNWLDTRVQAIYDTRFTYSWFASFVGFRDSCGIYSADSSNNLPVLFS